MLSRRLYNVDNRKPIIGIDLGTTNSCVAILENGQTVVIPNSEGARTTPSVVAFPAEDSKSSTPVVGAVAKRQAVLNHDRTLFATKRLIGRKFQDPTIQTSTLPYDVVEGKNGDAWVKIGSEKFSPSQIGALILSKMKNAAVQYTGIPDLKDAVITVPAYFDETQRQATKDAGRLAGLNVLRIINEPTAAALAYGIDKSASRRIAVYDLGGGTFDISILELNDGVFEVKATNGDSALGGEDIDSALTLWLVDKFKNDTGIDLKDDKVARQRIREAAETAKQELSSKTETEINLPFLAVKDGQPSHLRVTLSRNEMNEIADPILERTIEPCRRCLSDSGFKKHEIDDIILVGGMTRMPRVIETVEKVFGKKPRTASVNPDEAVAVGAAIQGGVMSGSLGNDLLLLDVTPLSLGIETMGGVFTKLIERNTTVPCKKSSIFSTAVDNQERVSIKVYQGERMVAEKNKLLGQFELSGIPPAARGVPQIEVVFQIDADGLLSVSAKDKATGQAQDVQIKTGGGLSQEEIDLMLKEAETNEKRDKDRVELIQAKSQAEPLVARAEALQKELSGKSKGLLEDAILSVRGAQTSAEIRASAKVLQEIVFDLTPRS